MEAWTFGGTLRRWRERVDPAAVGVPTGGRRRTAGLRREELAALAGISVDYLTRLEQGRATTPSEQVVEALTRALRVSDAEREHLFHLAGLATPGHGVVSTRITPSVQRLLDRLANTPVCVHDAAWNLIVANAPYDALMGQTSSWRGITRNAVWRNLVGPGGRAVHTPSERAAFEEGLVATLRMTAGRYPSDHRVRALIGELRAASARFVELWETAELPDSRGQSRRKVIDHPDVGRITVDCDVLTVAGDDLRVTVYTAEPGSHDSENLNLTMVLGTQAFANNKPGGAVYLTGTSPINAT